jgi:hypothetical protein
VLPGAPAAPAVNGGGSGLGLFISRQFATLMGGTLSCMSRPGEGAAFMLRVPLRVLSDEEAAAVAANAAAFAASSSQEAGVVAGTAPERGPAEDAAAAALDAVVADADAATAASPRKNVPPPPPPGAGGGGGARQQQRQPQMLRALFAVRCRRECMHAPRAKLCVQRL